MNPKTETELEINKKKEKKRKETKGGSQYWNTKRKRNKTSILC
jgi:hypothetical protein